MKSNLPPRETRIDTTGDHPQLVINDTTTPPLLYGLTDSPGSRWSWEEVPTRNIQLFADQGIHLVQVDLWLEQMSHPGEPLDITLACKQVAGVMEADPLASVMIRLHVTAPPWWCGEHPDACVGYADAEPGRENPWGLIRPLARDLQAPLRASFHSLDWKKEATAYLEDFCKKLSSCPEGDAVFSIQIADGTYGEWQQFGFLQHEPDTGDAARSGFIEAMKRRYASLDSLNQAWSTRHTAWSDIEIPDLEDRCGTGPGTLLDTATQKRTIDYYTWTSESVADLLLDWCAIVKEHWPRPVVTAAFFGYFYSMFGRLAQCGQLAVEKVLRSPALDCLCAPQSYRDGARHMGGTGQCRSLMETVGRAGKLWLDEMDDFTSLGGCPWMPDARTTLVEDIAKMRRNVLHPFTRGGGLWWYDFGANTATNDFPTYGVRGTWDDPILAGEIKRLADLMRDRLHEPVDRRADVLIVHDPMAFAHVSSPPLTDKEMGGGYPVARRDPLSHYGIDALGESLHQSGLVHEEATLRELEHIPLQSYKLIVFATSLVLSTDCRERLSARLEDFEGDLVFCAYSGWSDNSVLCAQLGSDWSGFSLRAEPDAAELTYDWNRFQETIQPVGDFPAIAVVDPENIIARWDDGTPAAGYQYRKNDCRSYFFSLPPHHPELLRQCGESAGCRILNSANDTTLVGRGILLIHTLDGGRRELQLASGESIEVVLPPASTTVFDASTGAVLIGETSQPRRTGDRPV